MSKDIYIFENGTKRKLTQEEVDLYNSPEILFTQKKEEMLLEVNATRDKLFSQGFPFDFGDPHGVKTLDTRSAYDRTNWLGASQLYQAQILAGNGDDAEAVIRTSDNTNITMTYKAAHALTLHMGNYTGIILNNSWRLKDAIGQAKVIEELDAIDITQGWPK